MGGAINDEALMREGGREVSMFLTNLTFCFFEFHISHFDKSYRIIELWSCKIGILLYCIVLCCFVFVVFRSNESVINRVKRFGDFLRLLRGEIRGDWRIGRGRGGGRVFWSMYIWFLFGLFFSFSFFLVR